MKRVVALLFILLIALSGCGGGGQGRQSEQMPAFSQASPPEAEALYRQAEQAYAAGKVPQAISLWEKIVQKYPNTPPAAKSLNKVGEIYLAQGQNERAAQYFEYLIYAYPGWEGVGAAKLNLLRLQAQTGKKKQVMKDAVSLWESTSDPEVRLALANMMIGIYSADGDIEAAFDWSASGFSVASTPEQKKVLAGVTVEYLGRADEGTLRKLYKKKLSDFMRAFLDFRYADIEIQKGQGDMARERLKTVLVQIPDHPLAPRIQTALRGTVTAKAATGAGPRAELPFNADKIGVLVPLNGPHAKYGDMVVRGLNMAISDWNERYPDQKVTLVIKDGGTEQETAAAAFNELTKKEGVLAVIGPLGPQAAKAVVPLANRDGVPLLTLTQKEDDGEHTFVLHVFIDSRELVRALVRHCREKLKYERFACLFPDDRYGQRLSKIFAEVVQEQGGNMIASASYKERSTDFKEPLLKLMNIAKKNAPLSATEGTPFEALFIPDQVQSVSLIAPQLPYNNIVGVTLLGTNLWSEAPLAQAGGVYVEQALFATSFYPDSQNVVVKGFRERFESLYNVTPSYLEAQAYDALILLLQSKKAVRGEPTRDAVFQTMVMAKGFKGVAGTYTVNPRGELERQYIILQVANGQLIQVSP
ncbi:MAG: penicillin-binding protein activator [Syntrophobacteraceae bacterium]